MLYKAAGTLIPAAPQDQEDDILSRAWTRGRVIKSRGLPSGLQVCNVFFMEPQVYIVVNTKHKYVCSTRTDDILMILKFITSLEHKP
jgi:hypothetical protein